MIKKLKLKKLHIVFVVLIALIILQIASGWSFGAENNGSEESESAAIAALGYDETSTGFAGENLKEAVLTAVSGTQLARMTEVPLSTLSDEEKLELELRKKIRSMSIEEKVAQLFIITPETLLGKDAKAVTASSKALHEAYQKYPVGGFIMMGANLKGEEQTKKLLSRLNYWSRKYTGTPAILSVDEEGGTVRRISGTGKFDVPDIGNMRSLKRSEAYSTGKVIGAYLKELGFNMDFAPVADTYSNPVNKIVKYRSFGTDPERVAYMSVKLESGLEKSGITGVYKHFPGHGATEADSHKGYAYINKSYDELLSCDLIPFKNAVDNGARAIMAGHIAIPEATGSSLPATLSYKALTGILRKDMGYDGAIITDALNMGAISQKYTSKTACVKAIKAGADLLLMPSNFENAYKGVVEAVKSGDISEKRLDKSVMRILKLKAEL